MANIQNITPSPMPKELSEAEFLENGLEKVLNKKQFLTHFANRKDGKSRLKYLNLVEPTKNSPDIKLKFANRDIQREGYLKIFAYSNGRKKFYALVTENNDKLLITGIPMNKLKDVRNFIRKAESVEFVRPTSALGIRQGK